MASLPWWCCIVVVLYRHGGGGGRGRPLSPFIGGGIGSSSFMVLGPRCREWVVVLGPCCCSSVVVVGPRRHSCMVVWGLAPCLCMRGGAGSSLPFIGDSAGPLCMVVWGLIRIHQWWYWALATVCAWWYWAIVTIHAWWCGASFTVCAWWCWVLITICACWQGSLFTIHATGPSLLFIDGGAGHLSFMWCCHCCLWMVLLGPHRIICGWWWWALVALFMGGGGAPRWVSCAMVCGCSSSSFKGEGHGLLFVFSGGHCCSWVPMGSRRHLCPVQGGGWQWCLFAW